MVNLAFSESGDSSEYYGGPELDLYESTVTGETPVLGGVKIGKVASCRLIYTGTL